MTDKPKPGETVLKETVFDDYNRLNVVPDSEWNHGISETDEMEKVGDDEFVLQARNSLGMIGKHHADEVEKRDDGEWVIPRDDD